MSGEFASLSRKVALTAALSAVAVVLSPFSFPVGPTKVYPAQHMVNGIGGVLIGPWYAAAVAMIAGLVRNALGTGSVFAFPGGVPGALVVGLVHRHLLRRDIAALTEPIGTAAGAVISALIVAPAAFQYGVVKSVMPLQVFVAAFLASSIPGSILGLAVLYLLRRGKIAPRQGEGYDQR
ncbi:MAG: energy coupling factor transporter S component ThiW [Candidatus Bathyarchaeia archaeon]